MGPGSDVVAAGAAGVPTPGPISGQGDGPVSLTPSALGRWWPLRAQEVALAEGSTLGDWQVRNSAMTLPHCVEQVVAAGALRNLERVAQGRRGEGLHEGMPFSDSDVYKVLEAAAWDSLRGTSGVVAGFVTEATDVIERAQRPDGYVNSWAQGQPGSMVWKNLRWGHELYCAGHLLQAAVATARAGGASTLLGVSNRLVEHLLRTFSLDNGDGRLVGVCGHPEVETALVEFYRLTGNSSALRLAQRQVELRGRPDVDLPTFGPLGDSRFPLSYFLHHAPVRNRKLATGHAVRELYLQAGVVDVATETCDHELLSASEAIWDDLYGTKTYVTGAHGSRHRDESIGDAYELPSDRAYAETCAAIASFQWNWRLLLATGRARYADEMERVFWNAIAGSVSRSGTEFFYSNSLHLRTDHDSADEDSPRQRLRWYQCSCCPPNLARLMASIQAYLVTRDQSGLQVHMPFSGTISTQTPGGAVELSLKTRHPWDGAMEIEVNRCRPGETWALSLRRPGWAGKDSTRLVLNGQPVEPTGQAPYITVSRPWYPGDRLEASSSMAVRILRPHWRADAVRHCVAVERGPLVYCLEAEDVVEGTPIEDMAVDDGQPVVPAGAVPTGLQGYVEVALQASGARVDSSSARLYGTEQTAPPGSGPGALTLIPYFSRGNRPTTAMRVWVPLVGAQPEPER